MRSLFGWPLLKYHFSRLESDYREIDGLYDLGCKSCGLDRGIVDRAITLVKISSLPALIEECVCDKADRDWEDKTSASD